VDLQAEKSIKVERERERPTRCTKLAFIISYLYQHVSGIIMPETCWDKRLIINVRLVHFVGVSFYLACMKHGLKNLKREIDNCIVC